MGLHDFKFEISTGDQCPTGSLYPSFSSCNTEPGKWLPDKFGDFYQELWNGVHFRNHLKLARQGVRDLRKTCAVISCGRVSTITAQLLKWLHFCPRREPGSPWGAESTGPSPKVTVIVDQIRKGLLLEWYLNLSPYTENTKWSCFFLKDLPIYSRVKIFKGSGYFSLGLGQLEFAGFTHEHCRFMNSILTVHSWEIRC